MFRPVKLRHYLAVMKEKGHKAEAVLAGSGITEEMLRTTYFLADMRQSRAVVTNMIALSGDRAIGLEVGSKTELTDLGLVGYAMMSSRLLRHTVEYWVNYGNALVGMLLQVRLEEQAPDNWSLTFFESMPLEAIRHFCVEEQLVMAYKLGCDLASIRPKLRHLELAYSAPLHWERYHDHFDCPVTFNARHTRLSFSSPRLDQTLRGNDEELNQLCARQCALVAQQMRRHDTLSSEIVRILAGPSRTVPPLDDVAREFNMSARTLRRHLQAEGLTYQQLVNDYRAAKAKELLHSSLGAKEISYRLGFSEPNSFRRAFKLWAGQTVSEYLKAQYCPSIAQPTELLRHTTSGEKSGTAPGRWSGLEQGKRRTSPT